MAQRTPPPEREPEMDFSLVRGGPLHRLLRALRVERGDPGDVRRLCAALVSIAWGPVALSAIVERLLLQRWDPLVGELSVHTRLLVAIPLLVAAEPLVDTSATHCMRVLASGGLVEAGPAAIRPIAGRAERLRDALAPELILLALAVAGAQIALWRPDLVTGWRHGALGATEMTPARLWYAFVGLPIAQLLLLRWLWRWAIWSFVLLRVSRLPIRALPMHADHAGGLAFLGEPTVGLSLVAMAVSAVVASAWATRILRAQAPLASFATPLAFVAVVLLAIAFGPLLAFTPKLARAYVLSRRQYDALAVRYVCQFERRWIEGEPSEALLGTPDIQSLSDLANSYESLRKMRPLPFTPRHVRVAVACILLPMLLLVLTEIPLKDLVGRIAAVVLGGAS